MFQFYEDISEVVASDHESDVNGRWKKELIDSLINKNLLVLALENIPIEENAPLKENMQIEEYIMDQDSDGNGHLEKDLKNTLRIENVLISSSKNMQIEENLMDREWDINRQTEKQPINEQSEEYIPETGPNIVALASKLKLGEVSMLTMQIILGSATSEIGQIYHFSSAALADWRQFINEVILDYIENIFEKIGGTGRIVEVDESKFGKRKYHRGHPLKDNGFSEVWNEIWKGIFSCSS
ncbi:uncharacterized protein NPIL_401611 [Nephila pilipes]|uniref:Transposase n=1 Tax=Nephila pilipes TaxID=299642 RepID=A0A8X6PYG1_NEPPI|nr:uncharacterized protein NPIL_401611 [Nephila pilipes]